MSEKSGHGGMKLTFGLTAPAQCASATGNQITVWVWVGIAAASSQPMSEHFIPFWSTVLGC